MPPRPDTRHHHRADADEEFHLLGDGPVKKIHDVDVESVRYGAASSSLIGRVLAELREQSKTAWPTLWGMLLAKVPWFISLRLVGVIGVEELVAAALATTIFNVTGISLSVGLSAALRTLAGQSKGELQERLVRQQLQQHCGLRYGEPSESKSRTADDNDDETTKEPLMPLVYLYRGFFVQMLVVIPVGIWWIFGIGGSLVAIGEEERLAASTEKYLRILAPALWLYSINWTCTAWMQVIGMADIPAMAGLLGLALHVPFNLFFISYLGWGYLGCAAATVAYHSVQAVFIFGYLFFTKVGRARAVVSMGAAAVGRTDLSFWPEATEAVSSLRGVAEYWSLALPGIVTISGWWASEAATLLSGRMQPMPEVALGGFSLYQTINGFCFMFPASFAVTSSVRVSNLLGAGKPDGAKFAGRVGFLSAACCCVAVSLVLYLTPHTFFPSLFAPKEKNVIIETAKTIPYLSVYVIADGLQTSLNGIVTGCGRQSSTVPIVVIAYWVVAIPLAYYTAFIRHNGEMFCGDGFCGVTALAGSLLSGTSVHFILMVAIVVFKIDWNVEARKASERLSI